MSALLIGYARCSTDQQDLTAQRGALIGLGVEAERIYVDRGLTGTDRERPGLLEALAACRAACRRRAGDGRHPLRDLGAPGRALVRIHTELQPSPSSVGESNYATGEAR